MRWMLGDRVHFAQNISGESVGRDWALFSQYTADVNALGEQFLA